VPWDRRGARTDEYLAVLRTLWCDDTSSYEGEYYRLPECFMFPKPVQDPHPPIHVGGESRAALRRVARHAQGWNTFNRLPDDLGAPLAELDELLAAEGRSRSDVKITVSPYFQELTADRTTGYAQAGADAVSAMLFATTGDEVRAILDALQPCIDAAKAAG
jgi:alkanesulfonate monooxygenase SsuD/methylene tetrahydromethanopterin reductase-like flavin-dependent oxidoreductase (luciferase family)